MDIADNSKLDKMAHTAGLKRSEIIREAVWEYMAANANSNVLRLRRSANKAAYVRARYRRNPPQP